MTHEVIVRFAPAYDARHFNGDAAGARPDLVVTRDAFRKAKSEVPTPVVIDHNLEHVVGHVQRTWIHDDVDYGTRIRKWFFASCELHERPHWLKRGSGVSWEALPLSEYAVDADTTVVTSCMLREISLLTPSVEPFEPLARVLLIREVEPAGEVITAGPVLRRYFNNVPMRIR